MSDTKYIILRSSDPEMGRLYGKKMTAVDWFIRRRSWLVHTEEEMSDRVSFADCEGRVSASATRQDDCKCSRLKPIEYSHPESWRNVYIPVTFEQELKIIAKHCEMADVAFDVDYENEKIVITSKQKPNGCYYGDNALKYDTPAVMFGFISKARIMFGFISKARIWKGKKKKVFCTEACAIALMEVWPDLLTFDTRRKVESFNGDVLHATKEIMPNPDELSPSLLDSICRMRFNERIEK